MNRRKGGRVRVRGGGGQQDSSTSTSASALKMTSSLDPTSMVTPLLFNSAPLNSSLLIYTLANGIGFLISILTGSHLHLDLIGTGAFALASIPTLSAACWSSSSLTRVTLSSAAVTLWGTKLAGFLFFRALKVKHDARLNDTLSTVTGQFGFWAISLLWAILCSLPHTLGTTSSIPGNKVTLSIGTCLYVLGIVTESLADYQKWTFKNNNPGQFCKDGLWGISQHPNFFGNLGTFRICF